MPLVHGREGDGVRIESFCSADAKAVANPTRLNIWSALFLPQVCCLYTRAQ